MRTWERGETKESVSKDTHDCCLVLCTYAVYESSCYEAEVYSGSLPLESDSAKEGILIHIRTSYTTLHVP